MEIAFKDTIDKIVSIKTGLPIELVQANTDFLVQHIKDLMTSGDHIRLRFPHLGTPFINFIKAKKALKATETSRFAVSEARKEFYKKVIDKIAKIPRSKNSLKHRRLLRMSNVFFTDAKRLEEQEGEQNNS